jgi:hypothetical protein
LRSLGLSNSPGVDEVQEVMVTGEVGNIYLLEGNGNLEAFFVGESAAVFQSHLEGLYGAHSVEVSGGPPGGLTAGEMNVSTYVVTFTGSFGDRAVPLIAFSGENGADGFEPTAVISQAVEGKAAVIHPDGVLVASAVNVGDEDAGECVAVPGTGRYVDAGCSVEASPAGTGGFEKEAPVEVVDKLPAGLEAVGVEGVAQEGQDHANLFCPRTTGGEVECTATGMILWNCVSRLS